MTVAQSVDVKLLTSSQFAKRAVVAHEFVFHHWKVYHVLIKELAVNAPVWSYVIGILLIEPVHQFALNAIV